MKKASLQNVKKLLQAFVFYADKGQQNALKSKGFMPKKVKIFLICYLYLFLYVIKYIMYNYVRRK